MNHQRQPQRQQRDSDQDDDSEPTTDASDLESGGDLKPLVSDRAREADARATLLAASSKSKPPVTKVGPSTSINSSSTTSAVTASIANSSAVLDSSLDRTTRALADTERFGQLTSAQLLIQREAFMRQRNQLAQTNEYLSRTKSILQKMQFRLVTDKLMQGVIIIIELAVIIALIYFKYYR